MIYPPITTWLAVFAICFCSVTSIVMTFLLVSFLKSPAVPQTDRESAILTTAGAIAAAVFFGLAATGVGRGSRLWTQLSLGALLLFAGYAALTRLECGGRTVWQATAAVTGTALVGFVALLTPAARAFASGAARSVDISPDLSD